MLWYDDLYGPSYLSDEERAKLAAEAPNCYSFSPLSWEMIDGIGHWALEDITAYDYVKTVIYLITTLSDFRNDDPGGEKGEEDHHDNSDDNDKSENEAFIILLPDYDPGIDYDALKKAMIMNNLLILSPQDSKYNKAEGSEYSLYVRRLREMMANVYVDGNRLPENGISYRTVMLPNGMYKIIFSREYMQSLGKGKHTVKMEFCNADDIETVIEVE